MTNMSRVHFYIIAISVIVLLNRCELNFITKIIYIFVMQICIFLEIFL